MKRPRQEEKEKDSAWPRVTRVISGGQEGADRAALEVAEVLGLETGGWAARDFMTTSGPAPELGTRFGLQAVKERVSVGTSYVMRSKKNVVVADATVAFRTHASRGTDKTIAFCRTGKWCAGRQALGTYRRGRPHRPVLVISELVHARFADNASLLFRFLVDHDVRTLNVCGHPTAPDDVPDYVWQVKRLLMLLLNPAPGLHARLDGVPLSQQHEFARYDGGWLREHDHRYMSDRHPRHYYMPSSTLQKRLFPQFEFKQQLMARRCAGSERSGGGKYRYCTPDEVLQMWEDNRVEASRLGTAMHNSFEDYYNGKPCDRGTPEFAHLEAFQRDHPHLVPVAAEKVMFKDWPVCSAGTVDIFFKDIRDPDPHTLVMGDWKRSKALRRTGFGGECGWRPATRGRPNCNFQHFTVNMTQYKFMVQQPRYGMFVSDMFLVGCHPDHATYERADIEWDRNQANEIVAERLRDCLVYADPGPPKEPEGMPWAAIPPGIMIEARQHGWNPRDGPRIELPSASTFEAHRDHARPLAPRIFHYDPETRRWRPHSVK